jgi:MFS family permease
LTRVGLAMHRTFHAVGHSRNFRLFFFGQLVSTTGTWMNATASAWLVLRLTDSGVALGINTALLFLPILLVGAWGGAMADRIDKRRILIGTQAAYAFTALSMWGLIATDVVQLWMVYGLSLLAGIVTALDNPTRQSFYMEMVGDRDLTNAVSLNSAAFMGSRIVGPAAAGFLIATTGIAIPFLVDGISYVAVLAALLSMRREDMHIQLRDRRERGHVREGLRYVWNTSDLRRPLVLMSVVFTMSFNFSVLVPLLAERTFSGSAATFGALSALAGLGSFIGALAMANRASAEGGASPSMHKLAVYAVASGVSLVITAIVPTLGWAYAAMVPLGFAVMMFIIVANSMLQLGSRPEFRGRVMAFYGMVFLGSTPVGSLIAGWVGEVLGPRAGFLLGGAAALAAGAAALRWGSRERAADLTAPEAMAGALVAESASELPG